MAGVRWDLLVGVVAAVFATACNTSDVTFDQPLGSVVTVVDSGPALQSAHTFVLPDTVIKLSVTASSISPALAHQIVAQVRAHFVGIGWTELRNEIGSRPDVLVLLAASTQVQTGVLYSDWFTSWGYLPYWNASVDPSWAWGSPDGMVAFSYQTGTLLVSMIDVRAQHTDAKTIPLLWAAALDGLVGEQSTMTRIRAGIDQAFEQSPYLRLN